MMIELLSGQLGLDGIDPLQSTDFSIIKRDGIAVLFDETRVYLAIESAFKGERGLSRDAHLDDTTQGSVQRLTETVVRACLSRALKGENLDIERVQDIVESQLMTEGHHGVARHYIVYREERKKSRALKGLRDGTGRLQAEIFVTLPNGTRERLDPHRISHRLTDACHGFEPACSPQYLTQDTLENLYDGICTDEISAAMLLAAKSRMEQEPSYTYVAARLLLKRIYREAIRTGDAETPTDATHQERFPICIKEGVRQHRLAAELMEFDIEKLSHAIRIDRDALFTYEGLQELCDQCLIRSDERYYETPQFCWMRVAMGLALNEGLKKTDRALEFYEVLSTFKFLPSIPTLRNAGTVHPQLNSCYLLTALDDLDHIFKVISDDARLSKWNGGVANDWTNIRATGSPLCDTAGRSQGVIPFVKLASDTSVAVNPHGKRENSICAYLETWHLDIGGFLELGKPAPAEPAHDRGMCTAHWIPDLFMKRVVGNGSWTLFSPKDVPDLHALYGTAFEKRYLEYEDMADRGEIKLFMRVEALQLWRKMLAMLFEKGHPLITFKDSSNLRSPQPHAGVIQSASLHTEVLLNTSVEEPGVCNLGSVNLAAHVVSRDISSELRFSQAFPDILGAAALENISNFDGEFLDSVLEESLLQQTIRTAMRMHDNAIDLSSTPTKETKQAHKNHRAIGIGVMGFQDALFKLRIPFDSQQAVLFADRSMESISYHAILASTELARERGVYPSFPGSQWDQGNLPIDTLDRVEKERGGFFETDRSQSKDWSRVRTAVRSLGMRNSNCLAISHSGALAAIAGLVPSIEPIYKHRNNMGEHTGALSKLNAYLIDDLKRLDLWDEDMVDDLFHFDGSIQEIDRVPAELKQLYKTAFEIDPLRLIECASRRQKWIDMGQSLTLYVAEPNGNKLHEMYVRAWETGLKATYRLQSPASPHRERPRPLIHRRRFQSANTQPQPTRDNFSLESIHNSAAFSSNFEPATI